MKKNGKKAGKKRKRVDFCTAESRSIILASKKKIARQRNDKPEDKHRIVVID